MKETEKIGYKVDNQSVTFYIGSNGLVNTKEIKELATKLKSIYGGHLKVRVEKERES
jgi:hypothetical protein